MAPVLVVSAHPDDEALGAGGTIARHVAGGDEVHLLFLTDGVGARGRDEQAARRRASAANRAAAILGAQPPSFLSFPDNRLDGVDRLDIVQAIERTVAELKPAVVYTHHAGDLNVDHAICHHAVLTACRPMPQASVRRIYAMEIPSATEWASPSGLPFVPTRFVDIAPAWDKKRTALEAYREEMRAFPHPRSLEAIEALARWRGATAGLALAEAFAVLRDVER
jgi:LmbE family N-acetylglucosaminyl deacetylase